MPKAKYEGIYRSIKKRIEAQDYPYQSLLPSENTLIEEYDCSRNTVRRAIAELTADGYVQAMQGRGVRVIYQPVGKTTFTIGGIETFQETARRNHLRSVTKVMQFETIVADEQLATQSGFSVGDELWAVQRVRYLDGKALILDVNYFLKEFVPGLTEQIAAQSIYDYIENVLKMQIITSKRRITVEHATVRDEKLLDMDGYDCVAVVVNQTFNSDGLLFEYTQSRHQPDYFCFQDIATRKKS
jgi:GntR family trehalose operon transcriptional repressor